MKDKVDRSVIGAMGGIIGGLAFIIVAWLLNKVVTGTYPKVLHIAHLFIPVGQDHTLWGGIIAHIAHFIVSTLLGILFINIFRLTGRDWATTKGLIFGGAAWIIIYGVMGRLLELPQQAGVPLSFVVFADHIVFGIATSWSVVWLSNRYRL